jgi:hypothetical protein
MPAKCAGEVLRMMVDVFNTGSSDGVEVIVDGDYLDHQGLDGQPIRGPSGFEAVVAAARSGYDTLAVTVEDLIESEDHAAARLRWREPGRLARATSARRSSGFAFDEKRLSSTGVDVPRAGSLDQPEYSPGVPLIRRHKRRGRGRRVAPGYPPILCPGRS